MDSVGWLGTDRALRTRAFLNLKSWGYSGWLFRRKMYRHSGWETTRAEVEGGEVGFEAFLGSPTGRELAHTLTFLLWLKQTLQMERQNLRGLGMSGKDATYTTSPGIQHPMASVPWGFHWPGKRPESRRDSEACRDLRPWSPLARLYKGHLLISGIFHYF